MAISTLSKFTVPLANDQSSASQGLLMPKLQYRFRASPGKFWSINTKIRTNKTSNRYNKT